MADEPDSVELAREQPDLVANTSIDDAATHFTKIIDSLEAAPIIIGHSFGGLLAEKLLGHNLGAAPVAIDPAQIKGVLPYRWPNYAQHCLPWAIPRTCTSRYR